jgi:hypothetical protein
MTTRKKKYNTEFCDDKMTFQECELAILRNAVDETEKVMGTKIANSDDVKRMIVILENFLIQKKLICYGGTAINNILPKYAQFYNRDIEIPDYDFFSANALEDAKELADIYYNSGYMEVEAKAGMHQGTFKVYVNFIPMADITQLNQVIYDNLQKEAITIAGIKYASPDYLRMAMYLELSRPAGDVSRWEKVLKRLTLLNEHYPLKVPYKCSRMDLEKKTNIPEKLQNKIYTAVRDSFVEQGVIFFGGYATSLYSDMNTYMTKRNRTKNKSPNFDVLSEDIEKCALITKEKLVANGVRNIETIAHSGIGEIIPMHIEIQVNNTPIAFIYKPIACHNYNTIEIGGKEINVATIDTMLSFYLAFIYVNKPYYTKDRILCMSKMLFDIEQRNRLEQKGLLKRFSIKCYGKQPTLEDIRAEKTEMFKKLADKRGTKEYEEWFLKYNPGLDKNGNLKKPMKEIVETSKRLSLLPKIKSLKYSKNLLEQQNVDVKTEVKTEVTEAESETKEEPVIIKKEKRKRPKKRSKRKNPRIRLFHRKTNKFLY